MARDALTYPNRTLRNSELVRYDTMNSSRHGSGVLTAAKFCSRNWMVSSCLIQRVLKKRRYRLVLNTKGSLDT